MRTIVWKADESGGTVGPNVDYDGEKKGMCATLRKGRTLILICRYGMRKTGKRIQMSAHNPV